MKHFFGSLTIAAVTLSAGMAAQAQSGQVTDGNVTLSLSPYLNSVLTAENVTAKYVNYSTSGYNVSGGTATTQAGMSLVVTQGGLTFKAHRAKVQLQTLEIDETGGTPYISAEVIADGNDMGRYPMFEIVSADAVVVSATNTPRKTTALHYGNVQFKLNPEFYVDFIDYLQFDSFDADQVLGTMTVDLVVKK